MNSDLLILGIGNEMRGDDAAGIILARNLAGRFSGAARLESNPYMLWNLLQSGIAQSHLALIDAAVAYNGFEVGQWRCFDYPDQMGMIEGTVLRNTHSVDVTSMLRLGETLHILPPNVRIYAVAASEFEPGPHVSPALASHLGGIEEAIGYDLECWLEAETCMNSPSHDPFATSR
ncbi:MAG TPA: hydrogenase maturation protease [Phycisphaerae bacterium]|nr:hydrogenase maturation protease [Phycisphaerae bacterium]